jgi:hypothetical protein
MLPVARSVRAAASGHDEPSFAARATWHNGIAWLTKMPRNPIKQGYSVSRKQHKISKNISKISPSIMAIEKPEIPSLRSAKSLAPP